MSIIIPGYENSAKHGKVEMINIAHTETFGEEVTQLKLNDTIVWAKPFSLDLVIGEGVEKVYIERTARTEPSAPTGSIEKTASSTLPIYHGETIEIIPIAADGYILAGDWPQYLDVIENSSIEVTAEAEDPDTPPSTDEEATIYTLELALNGNGAEYIQDAYTDSCESDACYYHYELCEYGNSACILQRDTDNIAEAKQRPETTIYTVTAGYGATFENTSTQDIFYYTATSLGMTLDADEISDMHYKYLTGIDLIFTYKPTNNTKYLNLYIQQSGNRTTPWFTDEDLIHFAGEVEIANIDGDFIMHIDLDKPYLVPSESKLNLMFDFTSKHYGKVQMQKKVRLYYTDAIESEQV